MAVVKTKKTAAQKLLTELAPIIGLVLCVVAFAVLTQGRFLAPNNLNNIVKQFVVTCLVAIGAVFSFAAGALDMSLSGSMCLSAVAGGLAGAASGSVVVMLVVVLVVSMAIAVVKGVVAAYLHLPVFIVTIVFSTVLTAIALAIMGNQTTISVRGLINPSSEAMTVLNIMFIVVFYLIALFLFNFTRLGKSAKLQGGNPLASGQSGINGKSVLIKSFLISGVGVALAAIISILSTKTVTAGTGGSVGTNIMVALVLGGMPLSGGPRSRISAAIVGAATVTVLNNGLTVMGVSNDIIQIIRGIIFLVVVYITSATYRTRLLPR